MLSNDSEIRKPAMTFRKRVDFGGECLGGGCFCFFSSGEKSLIFVNRHNLSHFSDPLTGFSAV